jgi:glycosyltransferase involved in cell wall biosynthesis
MAKILMLHKGGAGGVRGTEACVILSIEALHDAGHEIFFARNLPVIDKIVGKNVTGIIETDFPEILINGFSSQLPILAYAKAFYGLARLVRKSNCQLICTSGGLPCQLAVPIGFIFKIPILCQFHHPANRRYYYSWLVPFANKHIFPSKFTQKDAKSKANIAGDVVYNAVDVEKFAPLERDNRLRESLSISRDAIVVGQVGQLGATKRPLFLIRAFEKAVKILPTLHLCLVGRGPLEEQLRREVVERHLEGRVTITGYVEEVLPYYQHVFDINALVSSEEGLGISILEGAACGLPSLISDCTGLSETIIENVTGRGFEPSNENMLSELIVAMAIDSDFRIAAGAAGRRLVMDKFSLQQYKTAIVDAASLLIKQG